MENRERGIDKIKRFFGSLSSNLHMKREESYAQASVQDESQKPSKKKIAFLCVFGFVFCFILGFLFVIDFRVDSILAMEFFSDKKTVPAATMKNKPPFLAENKTGTEKVNSNKKKDSAQKKDALPKKQDKLPSSSVKKEIVKKENTANNKTLDKLPGDQVNKHVPVNNQNVTKDNKPVENQESPVAEQPAKPKVMVYAGIPSESPFVPEMVLESILPNPSLPAIPTGGRIPNVSHVPLPPPSVDGSGGTGKPAPKKEAVKITGISISSNGSSAIMSNGSVLSSGDTFNDNRIAWIGGDGIHFEDGSTIEYH